MLTTVAEFNSNDELIKAYVDLLAIDKVRNGSTDSKENIALDIKYTYMSLAEKEGRKAKDIFLDDALKCYNQTYAECESFIKRNEKLKHKDHYDYKIPLDLYNASKNDFNDGVVEMLAKDGNLFIKGASDTGKSHLAVAILREHIKINPYAKIEMFFEDDFHELTYEESQKEIKRLKKLDGIVFDDLGAIGLGIDKRNLIKGLIYSNFRNNKLVIICSNCIIDELYDSRTGSKIIGACTIINKQPTGTRKKNKKEITV